MKVAHVALWTSDIDSSATFWTRYFNAKVGPSYCSQRRPGFISRFVELPGGGAKIELMAGPWVGHKAPGDSVGWDHIAISMGDVAAVDAIAESCKAAGCLESSPRWTGDGFYEAVISAPDGTLIEVTA